jgi:hypothetical protein
MTKLSGVSSFQWSSTEQVWPFEKNKEGETLYCKEISLGNLPQSGYVQANINANINTADKIFKVQGFILGNNYAPWTVMEEITVQTGGAPSIYPWISGSTRILTCTVFQDYRGYAAFCRIFYSKN